MPIVKVPSADTLAEVYRPYFDAVGRVAYSWNRFQEVLARIFGLITGAEEQVANAVWYSTTSDRAQRDMLDAAAYARGEEFWKPYGAGALNEFTDFLRRPYNTFSDYRNNAIHSPCTANVDSTDIVMSPAWFFGHPRATRLQKENLTGQRLITKFIFYASYGDALTTYARTIESDLRWGKRRSWPDTLQLPCLDNAETRVELNLKVHATVSRPPPKPSPE